MLYTTSFSDQLLTFGSTTDPVLTITTEHMLQHSRQKKMLTLIETDTLHISQWIIAFIPDTHQNNLSVWLRYGYYKN